MKADRQGAGNADTKTSLSSALPCGLQTLLLTKGQISDSQDRQFGRNFSDGHIQNILQACENTSLKLDRLGLHYHTDFRYTGAYYGYADNNKDLARMEDVHFDFFKFSREFKRCGICFDYEIRVHHGQEHGRSTDSVC